MPSARSLERRPLERRHAAPPRAGAPVSRNAVVMPCAPPWGKRPSKPSRWMAAASSVAVRSALHGSRSAGCTMRVRTEMSYSSHTPAAPCSCWQVRRTERATSRRGGAGRGRRRVASSACGVEPPEREAGQLAEAGDGDGGVGQLELDGLERGDRLAELDPPVHVLDGQLDGPVDGAEHRPGGERQRGGARSCGGGAGAVVGDREVGDERAEPGARGGRRRGAATPARAGERADPPLVEQVAVVDAGGAVGHGRERAGRRRRAAAPAATRVGERDPPGGLAERGGGGERVGVVARVEVVDAERRRAPAAPRWRARSGRPRPGGPASTPPRSANALAAAAPNSTASSGSTGFTRRPPASSAFDTIIRCTSIVPRRPWRPGRSASGPRSRRASGALGPGLERLVARRPGTAPRPPPGRTA